MISKSSSKQFWFFSNGIVPSDFVHNSFLCFFCLLCFFSSSSGLNLENWRQPFFTLASELESSSKSPSGMFWDDAGYAPVFDLSLWPDSAAFAKNHWFIEPALMGGLLTSAPKDWKPGYFHIDILNDIRFRNFLVRQTVDVDKRYDYDPAYPAHSGRKVKGRVEEAYVQMDWKYGFLRLGRLKQNWGPFADRSLLLSTNPYSYDALEFQLHASIFEFRHLFAIFPFDKSQNDTDNRSQTNRCLTAHSLNIILGKWATLGISEAVVFARQSAIPDLQYINPVSIYSVVNTNQEGVGNLMLAFQWNIHPFIENVSFRGQIVLDDFQVDNELVTDQEPTHWGADIGVFWKNPFHISMQHLLKLQYSYKSEWLYTVPDQNADIGERFIYQQKSLGSPSNDGDTCTLGFSIIGKDFWAVNGGVSYCGKGIRSPLSRWRNSQRGDTILPLDTAYTKQRMASVTVEPLFYFKNFANLRLLFSATWIKNRDNLASDKISFSPGFAAELTLHYSNFFLSLPK